MQFMEWKDGKQNREDWCRDGANELKIWKIRHDRRKKYSRRRRRRTRTGMRMRMRTRT
jgi:hypothetical protein